MFPRVLLLLWVVVCIHGNSVGRSSHEDLLRSPRGVMETIKNFFSPAPPTELGNGPKKSLPPKLRERDRVPKPPKYPLYDLDAISLATPPPAPIMHPMSSLPGDQFSYDDAGKSSQQKNHKKSSQPQRVRYHGNDQDNSRHGNGNNDHHHHPRPNRRRGHPPPPPANRRNNPPHRNQQRPSFTRRHGGKKPSQKPKPRQQPIKTPVKITNAKQEYFSHPMATNLEPIKTSPALGRPLGFEEYMLRPSNSFVNDPWNFDPFANQMNAGLHTSALKYNYDPLGTNTNNIDMSHLDPNKLSFLGDSFLKNDDNMKHKQTTQYQGDDSYSTNPGGYGNGNGNQGNQHNHDNPTIPDSLSGGSSYQNRIKPLPMTSQKIEFTIETSPDGVNIQSVQPVVETGGGGMETGESALSDQYSPAFGPNGYSQPEPYRDPLTPTDMLPPPSAPNQENYFN